MRGVLGLLLLLAPAAGPAWSGPRVEVEHPHGIAQLRIDGERGALVCHECQSFETAPMEAGDVALFDVEIEC